MALLAGPILISVNSTGHNNYEYARSLPGHPYTRGFNDWMVTNLSDNDSKLWAHLVVFLVVTLLLYQAYDRMMTDLSDQRQLYLRYKIGSPSSKQKNDGLLLLESQDEKTHVKPSQQPILLQHNCVFHHII